MPTRAARSSVMPWTVAGRRIEVREPMAPATPIPHMFYLSDILGHTVFDGADRKVGVLHDMAAYMGPTLPGVTKIRVQARRRLRQAPSAVRQLVGSTGHGRAQPHPQGLAAHGGPAASRQRELLLWKNVLDKQMVDVRAARSCGSTTWPWGRSAAPLRVTGVAIGGAAVLRRLGFLRFARLFPFCEAARHRRALGVGGPPRLHRHQRAAQRADGAAGEAAHRRPGARS